MQALEINSLPKSERSCRFLAEVEQFSEFGEKTRTETIDGTKYFVNEFWTAKQRKGHRLHEISYRACFKSQLPAFFIERLTSPGEIVYDPFMGRGTTPLEAALRRRIPYGNDANPLSKALAKPRIHAPKMRPVIARLSEIPWKEFREFEREDLLAFYHPDTLAAIEGLRTYFFRRLDRGEFDRTDDWIRMVALNRLTGHSTGFFSVYTMPPNQAVSIKSQIKINLRRKQTPPFRDVPSIIAKKSKTLLSQGIPDAPRSVLLTGKSDETTAIPDSVVSLTVTSPPFLDVVNYETDNWMRCWFLGIEPNAVEIDQLGNLQEWQGFIHSTLAELARITCVEGHVAFEVGEVRHGTVMLEKNIIAAAKGLPFRVLAVMVNQQSFTKTSNCWGVSNNKSGTNTNRIVLLKRTN
ncbi:MAG: DNA methyltransferase [Albidovulum sp.]|nr:DNA methyltransferase [Albidovulum sp.]MDE0532585.1 DNA methyltransferase [Albidovulum sp.]